MRSFMSLTRAEAHLILAATERVSGSPAFPRETEREGNGQLLERPRAEARHGSVVGTSRDAVASGCGICGRRKRLDLGWRKSPEHARPGVGAHAERGERQRTPRQMGVHDRRRRLGHARRRRRHRVRARLGRQPVRGRQGDRARSSGGRASRSPAACPSTRPVRPRRDRGQGDRRHAGWILSGGGPGGKMLAFNKFTGALALEHHARLALCRDRHPVGDRLRRPGLRRRGVAGGGAGRVRPGLSCCRSGAACSRSTSTPARSSGRPTWPRPGTPGNAVWGSSPAIDTKRGQVYIATGNNYSVPQRRSTASLRPPTTRGAAGVPRRPTTTSTRSWPST